MNVQQLIGNVGKTPEITHTKSGDSIANFSVATSTRWKDKEGKRQERTEWHNCVVFGKLAGVVELYVKKGDKLYISGETRHEKWTDKEGKDRWTTKVIVRDLEMLTPKSSSDHHEAGPEEGGAVDDGDVPF